MQTQTNGPSSEGRGRGDPPLVLKLPQTKGNFKMEAPIDYAAVLADLRARRDELNAAIKAIEPLASGRSAATTPAIPFERGSRHEFDATAAIGDVETGDARAQPLGTTVESDSFFGLSTSEAAKKYLRMKKKPASTREISNALVEGGYLTNSKNFYVNVFTTLRRTQSFVSVQQKWGLAEWYPGRRLDQVKSKSQNGKEEVPAAATEDEGA
jgi:hypothetical protein